MSKIVDSAGYGAALSAAQYDSNVDSVCGINEAQTGTTYTVDINDQNNTIEFSNASAIAVTLTAIATIAAALNTSDFKVTLKNIGAGLVTYTRSSTDTIEGATSGTLGTGQSVTLQTDSTQAIWNKLSDHVSSSTKLVDSNGLDVLLTSPTTSAVNEITAKAATAGNKPSLNQTGADDVGMDIEGVEIKNGVATASSFVGPLIGNASTATNWASASSITLTGGVTGSGSINGTTNASFAASVSSGAVARAQLATNAGTNVSVNGIATGLILSGGEYGFYPRTWSNVAAGGNSAKIYGTSLSNTSPVTYIWLDATGSANILYASQRYITASPPYDLGDGEIQLFVFALIDNATGKTIALSVSPDAVWHYNGPTIIAADFVGADGKKYQRVKDLSSMPLTLKQSLQDPITRQEYLLARRGAPYMPREITQAIKNSDMNLIPHPFIGNDLTGKTVVMLDPVSSVVNELAELHNGGENVNEIIHEGNLTIGNTMLQRSGPAGLLIPSVRWRNTRR